MSRRERLRTPTAVVGVLAAALLVVGLSYAVPRMTETPESSTVSDRPEPSPATTTPETPVTTQPPPDPAPPEPTRALPLGVSLGFGALDLPIEQLRADLAAVARLGATSIRVDLSWARAEPAPGRYDWAGTDRVFEAARAAGLDVMAILGYWPEWAEPTRDSFASADTAAFARFADVAARRYARLVDDWEIWNEPNLQPYWTAPPDPADYARVVEAAAPGLRKHDPDARIVIGSMAPAIDAPDGSEVSPRAFLRGIYRAGIDRRAFDAVSVHPYSFPAMPSGGESWNTFTRLPELHQIMGEAGDGAKPLLLTEYGAPTGRAEYSMPAQRQATMLAAAYRDSAALDYVGSLYVYSIRDAFVDATTVEANFGLLTNDGRAKPAFAELRRAVREGSG